MAGINSYASKIFIEQAKPFRMGLFTHGEFNELLILANHQAALYLAQDPLPIKSISDPDSMGNVYLLKATFRVTFANGQSQEKAHFMFDSQIPLNVKALSDKVTRAP